MLNNTSSEIELLRASLKGDTTAFEAIVKKYQSLACAITFSATSNLEQSEELAHKAFINAWKNLAQLKDLAKFRAWFCSITHNIIKDYFKNKQRDIISQAKPIDKMDDISSDDFKPVETIINDEQQAVISRALEHIPQKYREPLVLFYRQDCSIKQVAQQLELSFEAANTRIVRGRKMLKDQVAAMIETTIKSTGPKKAFTTAVVASVAGLALKGTAVAAAATVSIMSTITAKIITTAAVVAVGVGGVITYKQATKPNPKPQPLHTSITVDEQENKQNNITGRVVEKEASQQETAKQLNNETTNLSVVEKSHIDLMDMQAADISEQKTTEPIAITWQEVMNRYSEIQEIRIVLESYSSEETFKQETWLKLPNLYKEDNIARMVIDNGIDRLEIDKKNQTAQFSDSRQEFEPLSENHTFNIWREIPEANLIKGANEDINADDVKDLVFAFVIGGENVPAQVWVDGVAGLPLLLEYEAGNKNGEQRGGSAVFDYQEIADKIFAMNIPAGFEKLPRKEPHVITGKVVDEANEPIEGTIVFATETRRKSIGETVTDANGIFEFKLSIKPYEPVLMPVFIRAYLDDEAIANANITLTGRPKEHLSDLRSMRSFAGSNKDGEMGTVTDADGYYEFVNIPIFPSSSRYTVRVDKTGYVGRNKSIETDEQSSQREHELNVKILEQQVRVSGYLKDNYGKILAERNSRIHAKEKSGEIWPAGSTVTDANGFFVVEGCPYMDLKVTGNLSYNNWPRHEKEKYASFVYYPNVYAFIDSEPNVFEYEVELIAEKPEITLDVWVVDSNDQPLPYFPVKILDELGNITPQWQWEKGLEKRTDENGYCRFDEVPKAGKLQMTLYYSTRLHDERTMPKEQRDVIESYRDSYSIYRYKSQPVELEQGTKHYEIVVTILTNEEFNEAQQDK